MATEIQDHKWLVDILKLISRISAYFINNNNILPVQEVNSTNILAELQALLLELQQKTEPSDNQNVQLKIIKDGVLTNIELDTTAPYSNIPIPVSLVDITGQTPVNVTITDSSLSVESIIRDKDKYAFSSTSHGAGQRGLDVEIKNDTLTISQSDPAALKADVVSNGQNIATESTLSTLNAKFVSGTDIGDVTINNGSGVNAVNIQDGGNSITIDGSVSIDNLETGLAKDVTLTNNTQTTQLTNASGDKVGVTGNALDINIKTGNITNYAIETGGNLADAKIDLDSILVRTNPIKAYDINSIDDTGGYYGYIDKSGNTLFKKVTATDVTYYKGVVANYTSNWTNRATLTYLQSNLITW